MSKTPAKRKGAAVKAAALARGHAAVKAARRTREAKNRSAGVVYWMPRREAGEIIDPVQAQRIGAVWRCVTYLAGLIAQPPWNVWRPRALGGADIDTASPVGWLLNRRPNPETSAFNFRATLMRHALLRGNGYAEIERTRDGRPYNLWQLHADRVTPVRLASGALAYSVTNADGSSVVIPAEDMFHVVGPSDDGVIGLPIITFAALSVGMSAATERYGAAFFENSAMPSGVLKHPKTLDKDASARIEESWRVMHGGRRSQRPMVLEEGMEFQALSMPHDQAQFLETRKATVEEICRWYGVPLQKVMSPSQATYKNMEQLNREVVQDTGVPWMRVFEQEADFKLLSDNRAGVFTQMDVRSLLRGDSVERSTYYRNLFTAGSVSVNEIREAEGFAPVTGGDSRYIQINMGRIDDDGTVQAPAQADGNADNNPAEPPADGENDPSNDNRQSDDAAAAVLANGHDPAPTDDERIIAALIPEVQRIKRGPRGQRGPRGATPTSLVRTAEGRFRLVMSDGSVIEESADAG